MVSGCVVGTSSTAIWLPLRASKAFSFSSSRAVASGVSVAVWSTTRPVSGGTATCANAVTANAQHNTSARTDARTALIAVACRSIAHFAGAGAALKSTFGAVEISFSFSTVKFGFSL